MIAALYVETGGAYFGLPDVDPWDERRDARNYDGPWPVVAHPPCNRWSVLAGQVEVRYGYRRGDDGGCFEHALDAVRTWGGVIEHPAYSGAWSLFGLPRPMRGGGWVSAFGDPGWSCWVDQGRFGHPLKKGTWLYAVGCDLPSLPAGRGPGALFPYRDPRFSETARRRMTIPTPLAFRDVLLGMARSAMPRAAEALHDPDIDAGQRPERSRIARP